MVNGKLTGSILDSMKLGYKIPLTGLEALGFKTEEDFYDTYQKDIDIIADYPEEPEELDFHNDNFKVVHTIVGELESGADLDVWRLTYHLVDIGVLDKLLGVILDLRVEPTGTEWVEEYKLETSYATLLDRGAYTEYLMVVENEKDIG